MLLALLIVVCALLLILGFLLPRLSRTPQRGVDRTLGAGQRGARQVPGEVGRWLAKPLGISRKGTNKSASVGRKGRSKVPL
jgi:hypothetical protein